MRLFGPQKNLVSDGNQNLLSYEKKESSGPGSVNVLDPAVEDLLTKLEMIHLRPIFTEQELTMDVLVKLDKEDLRGMGVKKVRDQMKIVKWIQEHQQQQQQLQQQQQQQQQMSDDIKQTWSSDGFYPSDEEISTAVSLGMISLK